MGLEDLKRKMHQEAAKVGVQFWSPKVGDVLIGEITEEKEIAGQKRLIFHDYPHDQYFVLPSHGHLKKQIKGVGQKLYIELAGESELKSGPGKGKMGKLYYVTELGPQEWEEVVKAQGTEEPITASRVEITSTDDAEDFDFGEEEQNV
jgi:hypothetical protein